MPGVLILPAYEYDTGGGPITINFTEPLADDDIFGLKAHVRESFGGSGVRQRVTDYIEQTLKIHHMFVPEAELTQVITMMNDWVLLGNSFKFIPNQDFPGVYFTVELLDKAFDDFDRMFSNVAVFEFKINVRKLIP